MTIWQHIGFQIKVRSPAETYGRFLLVKESRPDESANREALEAAYDQAPCRSAGRYRITL
jgi:hypothetical protein